MDKRSCTLYFPPVKATGDIDKPPIFQCDDMEDARIQLDYIGDRNEAVWNVRLSIDGIGFYDFGTPVTLSAATISRVLDVRGARFIKPVLTTPETTNTTLQAKFIFHGQWSD